MYSPLWKITHQNPSVSCTPPFEKSPITTHWFCVLPPLKIHFYSRCLFRGGRLSRGACLFRQIRYMNVKCLMLKWLQMESISHPDKMWFSFWRIGERLTRKKKGMRRYQHQLGSILNVMLDSTVPGHTTWEYIPRQFHSSLMVRLSASMQYFEEP